MRRRDFAISSVRHQVRRRAAHLTSVWSRNSHRKDAVERRAGFDDLRVRLAVREMSSGKSQTSEVLYELRRTGAPFLDAPQRRCA